MRAEGQIKNGGLPNLPSATFPHPASRTPLPVFSHQKCGAHDFAPHLPDHPDNPELPDHPRFKGHQILKFPFSPPSLQILLHALFHFSLIFSIILPLIL